MARNPKELEDGDGELAVKHERKTEKPRRYRVIFHNDDYTTKWFVVLVLMQFFHLTETQANAFMLGVHEQGSGVIGVYTKDVAETKVAQVMDFAKEHGMPLRLTAEPDD
jgi:ATP-dependent Clp protease adaptor protein ClpS